MAINVGQLVVDMRAETGGLVGDLGKAERAMGRTAGKFDLSLKGIQSGVGQVGRAFAALGISIGAISVGGLLSKFRELVDAGGALGELAQQLGITTDSLQALQYAAVQSGVESSELESSLSILTRTIGDAANGQESATKAFEKAGVVFADYTGNARSTEDVLRDIAERLKSARSEAARASIAQDLLGRSGQRLLPILLGGARGMDEWVDKAKEAGVVHSPAEIARMDEAADAMARFDLVMRHFGQTLAIYVIGPLADFLDTTDEIQPLMREITDDMPAGERALAATLNARAARIGLMPEGIGPPGAIGNDRGTTIQIGSAIASPPGGGGDDGDADRRAQALQRVIDALRLEADNLERTAEQQRLYNELAKAGTDLKTAEGQEIAALVHQIEQRAAAERELQELLAAEQALMAEGKALTESLLTPQEIYAAQLARLAELKAANAIGDETMARATENYTQELYEAIGITDKLDEQSEELNVNLDRFGSLLADAALGLRDWGDVARAVFQEAIDWLMRWIETAASTKSMGGGGGIFDAIFGLFGGSGSGSVSGSPVSSFVGGGLVPKRAAGGPVSAGRSYLVGEEGPELFTAAASGRILPTDRLAELGTGAPVFHIDARGASVEAVARLERMVARLHGSIESRAVAATTDARQRGGRVGAAFRR